MSIADLIHIRLPKSLRDRVDQARPRIADLPGYAGSDQPNTSETIRALLRLGLRETERVGLQQNP